MSGWRTAFAALGLTAALGTTTALAGCGVPTDASASRIPAADVPYGLADSTPAAAPTEQAQPAADPSHIYLVGADDALVPTDRDVVGGTMRERLTDLLGDLAAGPTVEERNAQMSSALPPQVELSVAEINGGTVTVNIEVPAEAPSGWASRRAVGQIVLTATSVPGVHSVRLTLAGERIDAPLPSGQLSSAPLSAKDYEAFLIPPAAASTTVNAPDAPTAGPAPPPPPP